MGDPKTSVGSFDSDPSLRHRELWNKEMEGTGLTWKNDFGEVHVIDNPKDLFATDEAKAEYGWDGTSQIESAPKLLAAIREGNRKLEEKRNKALNISVGIIKDVESEVDTSHLTPPERKVVDGLIALTPIARELDIKLKDLRGLKFRESLKRKNDVLGLRQFDRLSVNMCSPALPLIAPDLNSFCSPVDTFPNVRPTMGTYSSTELVPTDISKEEWSALSAFNADAMYNPYTVPYTSLVRDDNVKMGWQYLTLGQDSRYSKDLHALKTGMDEIASIDGIDRSLSLQLLSRAKSLTSDNPFDPYYADEAWVNQMSGNLDVMVGPMTGYSPMGKVASCGVMVHIVRKDEASTLEKYYIPYLQSIEKYYASLVDGYKGRQLSDNVPVRVVDCLHSSQGKAFTTLAFVHPDAGPAAQKGMLKRVIIANHLDAKFDNILDPLSKLVLVPDQTKYVSREHFVMNSAVHEISHGIGPRPFATLPDGTRISDAIGNSVYDAIEESKGNSGGIAVMQWIYNNDIKREDGSKVVDDEYLKKAYVTYVAGLFRQMRFGSKAHGGGAWSELNYYIGEGGVVFEKMKIDGEVQMRVRVDMDKMAKAIEKLWAKIGYIQSRGDKEAAVKLIDAKNLTNIPEAVGKEILPRVNSHDIPVDVHMSYVEKTN